MKDNVSPLVGRGRALVTENTEKAELLNTAFASVLTDETSSLGSLSQETRLKECQKEDFPLVEEDWVREHLNKLECTSPCTLMGCIHEC